MNNNINELFGEFTSAPDVPPPSINRPIPIETNNPSLIIDNNTLYKKLIEIQYEINIIKAIVNAIPNTKPIYYPQKPYELQPQMVSQDGRNISQFWSNPTNTTWQKTQHTNTIWKDNQTSFK